MTKTDTVVGIVGAVVLAAAMIGVFVYEYNNAPAQAADPKSDAGQRASFAAAHPTLDATGDLDGDQKANYADEDLDGDGVANGSDNETAVAVRQSGNVPQQPAPNTASNAAPITFKAERGATGFTGAITYAVAPRPPIGAAPASPTLSATLRDAGGQTIATCTNSFTMPAPPAAGQGTCTFTEAPDLEPGTYTIQVSATGPTTGGDFQLDALVHY